MAEPTYTAAQIRPLIPARVIQATADVASMAPGDWVYMKSDGDVALVDANSATLVEAIGVIVAIQGGKSLTAAGDVVSVAVSPSRLAGYSGMTPGDRFYVSETAGDIDTTAPSGAGTWTKAVGYAESASVFALDISGEDATSNS